MKTSESINKIAAALSKAQGEMAGANKAQNNPFYKSKYSDLSEVMAAIRSPFANNNLAFVQGAEFDENRIAVTTKIMHSSGQWIEATTTLPPTKNDAQGYGSAITYAKRYGLQALAGVPSIDDDANAAVTHAAPHKSAPAMPTPIKDRTIELKACTTKEQLFTLWKSMNKAEHEKYASLKDEVKEKLEKAA